VKELKRKKKDSRHGTFQEQSGLVFNEQERSNVKNLTTVASCCDSRYTVTETFSHLIVHFMTYAKFIMN
jgi:hypothetical protein